MERDDQHPAGANAEEGKDVSGARARVNVRVVHPPWPRLHSYAPAGRSRSSPRCCGPFIAALIQATSPFMYYTCSVNRLLSLGTGQLRACSETSCAQKWP